MRHTRRRALSLMSGIALPPRPPRGGWHRNDPGDGGGDGSSGHGPAGGGDRGDGETDDAGDEKTDNGPRIDGDFDAERAKRAIAAGREETKKYKAAAKDSADKLASVLKALGIGSDGKADPETQVKQLTDRATAAEQRANALAVQLAVRDAATKHSANTTELLDSTKFLGQLKQLDPTADDYADKVGDLVKKAVKEHPAKYGTTTAKGGSGRSGTADHTGGNGTRQRPGLGAAIAARMTPN